MSGRYTLTREELRFDFLARVVRREAPNHHGIAAAITRPQFVAPYLFFTSSRLIALSETDRRAAVRFQGRRRGGLRSHDFR
jgi:hypothetical protein